VTSIRRIRSSGQKLDAMSREIELREERIKELKDGRAKLVHRSKVHKVHSFSLYCLLVFYGSAFTLQPSVTVSEPHRGLTKSNSKSSAGEAFKIHLSYV
jgi:hypothetical protein